MNKNIIKTMYLFSLFNIIKGADTSKNEIEADKITIIDLLTNEEFKTTDTSKIDLGGTGIIYENIKEKFDLFENNEKKNLTEEQKNYKVMLIINNGNEIIDEKVDNKKNLDIYISPKTSIANNQICININNEEYKNEEIKNFINKSNKDLFKSLKKEDADIESKIIKLLTLENIKNGDKSINLILTTDEEIKKYYINELVFCVNEKPRNYKTIDENAINDLKNSILSNGSINLELKKLKNPIKLEYDQKNLKENIKELLEGIKNGRTDIDSNCKAIIDALKNIHNDDTYKIYKKAETGTELSNDKNEIKDTTEYKIELSKKCYEIEITAKFNITSKDKDVNNFKFRDTNILGKDNTIKFKVDKGTNLIKLKEILNDKFKLKDVFEKSKIIYKNGTNTINNETSFDDNSTIDINIDVEVNDLVINKNAVIVDLKIENNVAGRDLDSLFNTHYTNIILKNNDYNTLLNEIKKILKTDEISSFKIYKDKDEFKNGKTLSKADINHIIVKIIKVIENIYKDIDNDNNNDNNDDNQNPKNNETNKKNDKKTCRCYNDK